MRDELLTDLYSCDCYISIPFDKLRATLLNMTIVEVFETVSDYIFPKFCNADSCDQDGTNALNFQPINRQEARNNPGTNNYSFADNGFSSGLNYYRLKLVEHGSIIRYSVIIKTVFENEKNELKIAPDPVTGNFTLTYQSSEEDKVTIEINDITGRLMYSLKEDETKDRM